MTRALPVVALALALLIAPGPRAPEAQSSQKVTFALNWFAVGDHAAYWSRSTAATTRPRASTSRCRAPRARETRSPR